MSLPTDEPCGFTSIAAETESEASTPATGLSDLCHDFIPGLGHHIARIDLRSSTGNLVRPDPIERHLVRLHRPVIEAVEEIDRQVGPFRLRERENLSTQHINPAAHATTLNRRRCRPPTGTGSLGYED